MNSIGFNPDNLMDVVTIVVVALISAVSTVYASKAHKGISAVREQVENKHASNLRDDIDRCIHAVESLTHDLQNLRRDLMAESDHRRLQISDLRTELDHRDRRH
jgi:hypothetical protein